MKKLLRKIGVTNSIFLIGTSANTCAVLPLELRARSLPDRAMPFFRNLHGDDPRAGLPSAFFLPDLPSESDCEALHMAFWCGGFRGFRSRLVRRPSPTPQACESRIESQRYQSISHIKIQCPSGVCGGGELQCGESVD